MPELVAVVIARPDDPALTVLESLPPEVHVTVGDDPAALRSAIREAEVLVHASGSPSLLAALFPEARRLRWVHALSAGVDHLLFPELVESPVPLTNARGVYSRALAEFVMTAVLHFDKDVPRLQAQQRERRWEAYEPRSPHGRTMVVVGLGDIGRATARLARAFGMRIVGVRRQEGGTDRDADEVVSNTHLDRVLPRADVLVLSAPLTPETRHLLDARRIALLSRHALVVNVGRGPVVDQEALTAALGAGRIGGAALDVFETEPLPPDDPLWRLPNVLLSPHTADHTAGWREESMRVFVDNTRRFRAGEPLRNVVDKRRGY
jgi:phosphoglycerate dehydrogenase-like enzyme